MIDDCWAFLSDCRRLLLSAGRAVAARFLKMRTVIIIILISEGVYFMFVLISTIVLVLIFDWFLIHFMQM